MKNNETHMNRNKIMPRIQFSKQFNDFEFENGYSGKWKVLAFYKNQILFTLPNKIIIN